MARFVNVSHVKQFCKGKGKRVGKDFLYALDVFIQMKLKDACETKDGSRITLGVDVANHVGLKI